MHPRLYRLTELHQRVDRALRLEQGRRLPDPFALMRLNKLKLAIKERLFRATRQLGRA
jgi:uncharacterized protein